MFHDSTQKKFWLLSSSEKIVEGQTIAISKYMKKYKQHNPEQTDIQFLEYHEERLLIIYYSHMVIDICRKFRPPVPMTVVGTAMTYFKRFFLNTSVMEFHPKDVAYLCVYLACKVDEYNVSIDQFIGQAAPTCPEVGNFVIDNELLLLQKLNFHLTVHNPYRPLEGFFIDVKAKNDALHIGDIEQHRSKVDRVLGQSLLTDVSLMFPPSQIALAVLRHCAGKQLDVYIKDITPPKIQQTLYEKLGAIQEILVNFKFPTKEEIRIIEQKLSSCRDFENDPSSPLYHSREKMRKNEKESEKQKKYQESLNIETTEQKLLSILQD